MKRYKSLYVDSTNLNIEVFDQNIVKRYIQKIKKHEKITPVFVDVNNSSWIVDGNHRAKAYEELHKPVPIVYVNRLHALKYLGVHNYTPEKYYNEFFLKYD